MTEVGKRDLINRLSIGPIATDTTGDIDMYDIDSVHQLMRQAAAALEDTLWKPIADMPDELKDGRQVLLHGTWRGKKVGTVLGKYSDWLKGWNYNALPIQPTHYMEITPPEGELK